MAKRSSTKPPAGTTANPAPANTTPAPAPAPAPTPAPAATQAAPRTVVPRQTTAGSPTPATANGAATESEEAYAHRAIADLLGDNATGASDVPATATPELNGESTAVDDAPATMPEDDLTDAEDSATTGDEAAAADPSSGEPDDEELPTHAQADEDGQEDEALEALAAAKGWPKSYLRRIQRERAKARKAAEQLADLQRKVDDLEASRPPRADAAGASEDADTAPVTDEETRLTREAEKLAGALRTLARNRDGMTITENGQPRELSPEEVEEAREDYRRRLARTDLKLETLREQRQERSRHLEAQVIAQHPWMADKASQDRALVEAVFRQYPALAAVPGMRLILANNLAYGQLRARAAKANGGSANGNGNGNGHGQPAPPPPRTAPRTPARASGAPTPLHGDRAALGAAHKRFNETGDHDAGKELVSALLG